MVSFSSHSVALPARRSSVIPLCRAIASMSASLTRSFTWTRLRGSVAELGSLDSETMASVKRFRLEWSGNGDQKRQLPTAVLHTAVHAALVVAIVFCQPKFAVAQQASDTLQGRKAALEVQKLELEVSKLNARELPGWLIGGLGLLTGVLTGVAGTVTSVWIARRARHGALDQSVHDKRLEAYPDLMRATAPFAVYFPAYTSSTGMIDPKECGAIGHTMSQWYFGPGGLLLSEDARDAYFRLARALTRASSTNSLKVPTFPVDAERISIERLNEYRKKLSERSDLDDVESWTFGGSTLKNEPPHSAFKDYVFFQRLSSRLRTALSEDLRGRRRPS